MARRSNLIRTGLILLAIICFVINIVFIAYNFANSHQNKLRDIQEININDNRDMRQKENLKDNNNNAIITKRKRRPSLNNNHENHHHGKRDWDKIKNVHESDHVLQPIPKASQEKYGPQENILQQLQQNEEQMREFLLAKHFNRVADVDDKAKEPQNQMEINQEMMMKFFDKDASSRIKDVKRAHQAVMRNAAMEGDSQKVVQSPDKTMHGKDGTDNRTVTNEPYFLNNRAVDKNGPGLMGAAAALVNMDSMDKEYEKAGYKKHSFNEYLSRKMSLRRTLTDHRYPECRDISYPRKLPKTSIIICFHNEAWSTLLRTLHSILDRSPHHLIEEILFIDDGSLMEHLKEPLDDYIANIHEVSIRIIRSKVRIGLIRARVLGAKNMRGEILTFLDSHIEASVGWLEPLLARIAENRTRVVMPVVDVISEKNFQYLPLAEPLQRGGFNWRLQYRWKNTPVHYNRPITSPIRTPAMPGGLFSMDRDYFFKLGAYDPGMDIWGGENIEESLKVWMCGGSIEIIPCSRVGHIFRSTPPYSYKGKLATDVVERNARRVAEVWTDEYKQHFLDRLPHLKYKDYGNVSDRVELRKQLRCKSFQWYLDEIYPELYRPRIENNVKRSAAVKNTGVNMCLDSNDQTGADGKKLIIWNCHGKGGNQYFEFTADGEIRNDELCLEGDATGRYVLLNSCRKGNTKPVPARQQWVHKRDGKLYNPATLACMSVSSKLAGTPVELRLCNPIEGNQRWQFT